MEMDPAFGAHTVVPDKNVKTGHFSTSSPNSAPGAQQLQSPVLSISALRDFGMVGSFHRIKVDPCFDRHAVVPAKKLKSGNVLRSVSPDLPSAEQLSSPVPAMLVVWHTPSPICQEKHNQSNAGHASMRVHQAMQESTSRKAEVHVMQRSKSIIISENSKPGSDIIKLRPTANLLDEVKELCGENPKPSNLETAKLILKDQEKDILDALGKLGAILDGGDDTAADQWCHKAIPKAQMVGVGCPNALC